jgi:hypothetical protein
MIERAVRIDHGVFKEPIWVDFGKYAGHGTLQTLRIASDVPQRGTIAMEQSSAMVFQISREYAVFQARLPASCPRIVLHGTDR